MSDAYTFGPRALTALLLTTQLISAGRALGAAQAGAPPSGSRPFSELTPTATIHLGKTADWVVVTPDAVWVGGTGPNAVHRIDPVTNKEVATVKLAGEPCAGLAVGFGSVWIPLCTQPTTLAKVDLRRNTVTALIPTGPAGPEGGVAAGGDSVWLVVDSAGSLARIDPDTGAVRQTIRVPAGSYNPFFSDGRVWVTRADGAELTSIDAASGRVLGTTQTGPGPRFLTAGGGSVWTLNQGDGSLTRIDVRTGRSLGTIPLGTPGHGGDIGFGGGMVWTTMPQVPLSAVNAGSFKLQCQWAGPGGDSLGIGHGAIWLTDYHAGTISRLELTAVVNQCGTR